MPGPAMLELAGLVDAIGSQGFADRLLSVCRTMAGADMVSAFLGGTMRMRPVLHAGPQGFAERATFDYARRYWRGDPGLARFAGASSRGGVFRLGWGAIRDPEYRRDCYESAAVEERLSYYRAAGGEGGTALILNLYRLRASGVFPSQAVAWLEDAGPLLASALRQHDRLTAEGDVMLPDADTLTHRLCAASGGRLAQREAQICAFTLLGYRQSPTVWGWRSAVSRPIAGVAMPSWGRQAAAGWKPSIAAWQAIRNKKRAAEMALPPVRQNREIA